MAVSNFKFPFYRYNFIIEKDGTRKSTTLCTKGSKNCYLKTKVVYNHISEKRFILIDDEYEEGVGIHLFHTEVWEEPDGVQSVFSSTNNLSVEVVLGDFGFSFQKTLLNKTYENIIALYQDVEKKIWIPYNRDGNIFVSKSLMSYRCQGYAGINCEHDCMKEHKSIECHRDMNEKTCKEKSDDPSTYFKCQTDQNPCKNGALCIKVGGSVRKVNKDITYCVCPQYFRGSTCEDFYCDIPCDPRHSVCGPNNKCLCTASHKGGDFCNETICPVDGKICENGGIVNTILCICDTQAYGGIKCEHSCNPRCINGVCVAFNKSQNKIQKQSQNTRANKYDPSVVLLIVLIVLILVLYVFNKRRDKHTFIIEDYQNEPATSTSSK
ncbi:hypothetical protein RF11_02051 [Thelohanellus kitauei]|uniref:EGF-like domain-containing protein n=1 Tax=Thelohanellus kitauei TaxID=669202 RepID=A0A0C2ILT8_THEKT|nr:hypothetical protein RF11_02051 [Thelohanellus kitauei]